MEMPRKVVNAAKTVVSEMADFYGVERGLIFEGALLALKHGGWRQGYYAASKHGGDCYPVSEHACAWCLIGALGEGMAFARYGPRAGRSAAEVSDLECDWDDWECGAEEPGIICDAEQELARFNDAEERRAGEVYSVLQEAARQSAA